MVQHGMQCQYSVEQSTTRSPISSIKIGHSQERRNVGPAASPSFQRRCKYAVNLSLADILSRQVCDFPTQMVLCMKDQQADAQ